MTIPFLQIEPELPRREGAWPCRFANFEFALLILVALTFIGLPGAARGADKPLNFVLVLVDDMGWTGLSCMGSDYYQTPRIDRLAEEGMRFTDAYSACTVCSPTRAAVLTGRYPARLRVTNWIAGFKKPKAKLKAPDWTQRLVLEEQTLPEMLKTAGYVSASIGKWHLGGEEYGPLQHGFDKNVGGYHRGAPPSYFSPYRIPTLKDGRKGEYLTDREAEEAVRFIKENKDRPFFLYLPHYAVHTPIQAKKDKVADYRSREKGKHGHENPVYAAMTESVDESMGRILDTLDDLDLTERTVVIFTSDNGGLIGRNRKTITGNAPLRAGKGSSYEGGVRVPLIIRWPGVVAPGSVSSVPVSSVDYFPTIMELAGVEVNHVVDGVSLVDMLKGGELKRDDLYWHFPHYHPGGATPYSAIRSGAFKLIEYYEDHHVELFNLKKDLGEGQNLANQMPGKVHELRGRLNEWRKAVKAQDPIINPAHDPESDPVREPRGMVGPGKDGGLRLRAREAVVHGKKLRYEPEGPRNALRSWTEVGDWASWDFKVRRTGRFAVYAQQACGAGHGGSEVVFSIAGQDLEMVVSETGSLRDFVVRLIGEVEFAKPGRYQLTVRPRTKSGEAVMALQSVRLQPIKAER